jgi:hypothetical protein
MADPKSGYTTQVQLDIEDMELGWAWVRLEWKAMVNNGYVVRGRLEDPHYKIFADVMELHYLKKARNEPIKIKFRFIWRGSEEKTETRIAYITDLYMRGTVEDGWIEFIAVDPPTWLLSRGKAEGKHYKGSVSDVIKQVCQENGVSDVKVSKTIDNKKGDWWMMRQDPKTFILSLLDWSCTITPNETKWVVNAKDEELIIKEEYDLESEDFGVIRVSTKDASAVQMEDFEVLFDNFSHVMYSEEHTAGLSAVSGYFIDTITEEEKAKVYDNNTGNKSNTSFGMDRGFKKPSKKFATFTQAIPEDSAGGVGLNYKEYIDGRARREFLNMLGFVSRMRLRISGQPEFDDPLKLGVSTVTLKWVGQGPQPDPYFLSGNWMVSAFYHIIVPGTWTTDLFINRLDYDAAAKKVGPNGG